MGLQHRTGRLQHLAIRAALMTSVVWGVAPGAVAAGDDPGIVCVRSTEPWLAKLIDRAAAQSPTFQGLLSTIQRSNGMVQVEDGKCGHGVWACLRIRMETVNSTRFLRIVIDRRKNDSDLDVMASLGHELQHAVEALSEPGITDSVRLYNFFGRLSPTAGDRFETKAALRVGNEVHNELRGH
jgi:hypothetical protein